MRNLRKIFRFKHFQIGIMALATVLMVHNSVSYADPIPPAVSSEDNWSAEDLNSSNNYYAWYDPTVKKCVFGASGSQTVATGPAADLLLKAGLDKNWVNVIIKYASANGTDPVAMAALLFWENRGFPAYTKTGWANSPNVGSGPWQITAGTWPNDAGPYPSAADDPDISTKVAAGIVKRYGGVAGYSLGYIKQDFGKGVNLKTVATLAKNYNAGQGTWRTPGVSDWMAAGRSWLYGSGTNWGGTKNAIIDDYVVAMTYLYYQIASGQKITYKDSDSYVKEGSSKSNEIKSFVYKPGGAGDENTSGADQNANPKDPNNNTKPVIVLDPGHAPATDINVDPQSNIAVIDSPNPVERRQMWEVATKVQKQLESAGYTVELTKKNADDGTTNLKKRADFAQQKHAALGVSLHTTPGGESSNMIFVPNVGDWRWTSDGKTKKYYGKDSGSEELAKTDRKFAKIMADTRKEALGQKTDVRVGGYLELVGSERDTGRNGLVSKGSVLITQYFAQVPWVYNEQQQDGPNASITDATLEKYVKGVVEGVKKIVPTNGSDTAVAGGACGDTTVGGGGVTSIVNKAIQLAWPQPFAKRTSDQTYRTSPTTPTQAYVDAMRKFNKGGLGIYNGADCGVFVATVMRSSGADPKYPASYTPTQAQYVVDHPDLYDVKLVTTTADLQPGDVLIVNAGSYVDKNGKYHVGPGAGAAGHTLIWLGPQANGYDEASASLGSRSGNQGKTDILNDSRGKYIRARLKQ